VIHDKTVLPVLSICNQAPEVGTTLLKKSIPEVLGDSKSMTLAEISLK
jgi:hypothetical protein